MLEGLLVDLVPYSDRFKQKHGDWWNNESRFWGSMGDRPIVTQAQIDAEHARWREEPSRPDDGVPFGIQTKDGTPIGYFGINWLMVHNRVGMLGAVINESAYWGGGYGTDALLLCVDYAFDALDLRKLWLVTMSLNARVLRQMEKVGFLLEARQRKATMADGEWYDVVTYGLLREEWPGRAAMIDKLGLRAR